MLSVERLGSLPRDSKPCTVSAAVQVRGALVQFREAGLVRLRVALTKPLFLVDLAKPLQCDVLAAETDNNVSVKGVEYDKIDVVAAVAACRADLQRYPSA